MSTPPASVGELMWPRLGSPQPFQFVPAGNFKPALFQHRRLVDEFLALRGPLEDAVALTADLLHHGSRLVVLGHGASQQVAALLADEINRRARRWTAASPQRAPATAVSARGGCFGQANGQPGDIAWWLANNGDAVSLQRAVAAAHRRGMANVAIVGGTGGGVRELTDICLAVPQDNPIRVREAQLFLGHALVRQMDAALRPAPAAA